MLLGKGSSGSILTVEKSERKWLRQNIRPALTDLPDNIVKKVFRPLGSEALSEFYFNKLVYSHYPSLFVRPLWFVHAESPERYDMSTAHTHIMYMERVSLQHPISELSMKEKDTVVRKLYDIARALSCLGIIHNDINLYNLSGDFQLMDFGKASFDLILKPLGKKFSTPFTAPEHLQPKLSKLFLPNTSDFYSCGVCLDMLFDSTSADPARLVFLHQSLQKPAPSRMTLQEWATLYGFPSPPLSTSRENVFCNIPYLNEGDSLFERFVQKHQDALARFVLLYCQHNKQFQRRDPLALHLGSLNLFVEFLLHRDRKNEAAIELDHLVPFVEACRALIVNLLCPVERLHTDKHFLPIQYLILRTLHYNILFQPLSLESWSSDTVLETHEDVCKLVQILGKFETYPRTKKQEKKKQK
jgi:hypothetical protein